VSAYMRLPFSFACIIGLFCYNPKYAVVRCCSSSGALFYSAMSALQISLRGHKMTRYDLHTQKVNLTMVSAHDALKAMYRQFGGEILKQTIESFEYRDNQIENTPPSQKAAYVKGGPFIPLQA